MANSDNTDMCVPIQADCTGLSESREEEEQQGEKQRVLSFV